MKRFGNVRECCAEAVEEPGREPDAAADHDEGRIEQLLEIEDEARDGRGRAGEDLLRPRGAGRRSRRRCRGHRRHGPRPAPRPPCRRLRRRPRCGRLRPRRATSGRRSRRRRGAPVSSRPPETTPPPMPVEMVRKTMSCPSPAPKRCSPHAAACASLASVTGLAQTDAESVGEREAGRDGKDRRVERVPAPVPDLAGDRGGDGAIASGPVGDERGERVAPALGRACRAASRRRVPRRRRRRRPARRASWCRRCRSARIGIAAHAAAPPARRRRPRSRTIR